MSIVLSDFIANLSNIVRPNRFLVFITPPEDLLEDTMDAEVLKFYVQSATIPDRTFANIEMKYFGMTYRIPGNETLSDLTITFINDNEWECRNFFEAWANAVNDRADSTKAYVSDLFKGSNIRVQQLGYTGEVLAEYLFHYVYPKTVSEIELSYETTDSHETFQVTFDYSYFDQVEVEKTT